MSVRDVGKCHEIYARPIDRLRQTLHRGRRQFYREFWALRHVSFDVVRGDSIGIIGRNGSGKSTLLQIIAGTLRPTEGEVTVRGRVAALLELGSGFNPEFTGRENVYLNGAILGLSRRQIEERFDEIAAFADIGQFIEQPVKTYSTGMVVRLAFSVQALLEPDILIIDEALAVGDMAFQFKCINHMKRLLEKGTSVILVSHDIQSVRMFCERAVWLCDGQVGMEGGPLKVTAAYMRHLFGDGSNPGALPGEGEETPAVPEPTATPVPAESASGEDRSWDPLADRPDLVRWGSGEMVVEAVRFGDCARQAVPVFEYGEEVHSEVRLRSKQDVSLAGLGFAFALRNTKGLDVILLHDLRPGLPVVPLAGRTER